MNDLTARLIDSLRAIPSECAGYTSANWTRAIKEAVAALDIKKQYYMCASSAKHERIRHGEWLFDLVWADYGGDAITRKYPRETWKLRSVPLILESEWPKNDGDILDDFEKLLFFNAQVKVFIFDAPDRARAKARFAIIKRALKDIQTNGHYIVCCYQKHINALHGWDVIINEHIKT